MDIWTPCIIGEVFHENGWHDFVTPKISGHFINEESAINELKRCIEIIANDLMKDSKFIRKGKLNSGPDIMYEKTLWYTDRIIRINGCIYHYQGELLE